ncbi:hypothetical protein EP837_03760 (plasmid) [Sphingobium sp. EP60837]|nr:hypothetical protein EP837_03760 [Sphingobium sp. EP60837]
MAGVAAMPRRPRVCAGAGGWEFSKLQEKDRDAVPLSRQEAQRFKLAVKNECHYMAFAGGPSGTLRGLGHAKLICIRGYHCDDRGEADLHHCEFNTVEHDPSSANEQAQRQMEGLAFLVVTAQRKSRNLQDVPFCCQYLRRWGSR